MQRLVKLKNGAEEFGPIVASVMLNLRSLDPIACYELVEKCRKPDHKLSGNSRAELKALALIETGGHIHDTIRNVVLSAAEGDGVDLIIGSPLAPNQAHAETKA